MKIYHPYDPPEFRSYPMRFKITPAVRSYLLYCARQMTLGFVRDHASAALHRRVTFLEIHNESEHDALYALVQDAKDCASTLATYPDLAWDLAHTLRLPLARPLEALALLADG